jgi:anti-anti-sigma factor
MTLGDVQISLRDSVVVAELTGEVDLSNTRGIEESILLTTPNHATLAVLDLGQLDYLDSAGIQLIYQLREKLKVRGQQLRVVIPTDSPASDALRLAGVLDHLETFDSLIEALTDLPHDTDATVLGETDVVPENRVET